MADAAARGQDSDPIRAEEILRREAFSTQEREAAQRAVMGRASERYDATRRANFQTLANRAVADLSIGDLALASDLIERLLDGPGVADSQLRLD